MSYIKGVGEVMIGNALHVPRDPAHKRLKLIKVNLKALYQAKALKHLDDTCLQLSSCVLEVIHPGTIQLLYCVLYR